MNDILISQKRNLRREMMSWRNTISIDERNDWNRLIYTNVTSMPEFDNANCVAGYVSFKGEVDPQCILQKALDEGKRVVLPVTDSIKKQMYFREVYDLSSLVTGNYGILEPPKENVTFNLCDIDFAIIPGVAFSEKGERLGYGGGYYDKTLVNMDCIKVGIAFNGQLSSGIPVSVNDIKMDIIVTECRTLKFY